MLKLRCTRLNMANTCLFNSADAKIYPLAEGDKDHLEEKIQEGIVGRPSIVFTRKALVDETFIRKSTNICESIVGIDASQLYPYSICQPMPVGLYTRWDIISETSSFTPLENKTGSFEKSSCFIFDEEDLIVRLRASTMKAERRKLTASVLIGFVLIATLCLKQWVASTAFAPVKSCVPLSLKKISNVAVREENWLN